MKNEFSIKKPLNPNWASEVRNFFFAEDKDLGEEGKWLDPWNRPISSSDISKEYEYDDSRPHWKYRTARVYVNSVPVELCIYTRIGI